LPASFVARLDAIKKNSAATSDSEVIRQMIMIMELVTGKDVDLILRDRKTGKDKQIIIP
jgi:hypothetical protein